MELCHGNLKNYVDDQVSRKQKMESRWILSQIATGLSYLHGHKIIHKDLKPQNILYQQKASSTLWKLSDFVFARKMRASKDEFSETEHLGTAGYVAPELYQSKKPTFASDVWALGAVLFFVVSEGRHPYEIENFDRTFVQVLIQHYKTAPGLDSIADDWAAADLTCHLLHYSPENRPSTFIILHHPFFAVASETSKKYLAFKIFNFWLNQHDGDSISPLAEHFNEANLYEWYQQYESALKLDEVGEDIARVVTLVNDILLHTPTSTDL